jgi:predicted amidohydrolase
MACIQISSDDVLQSNISRASLMIAEAAQAGAEFISLPENVACMPKNPHDILQHKFEQDKHPALQAFQAAAVTHKIWLLVGSIAIYEPARNKLFNRSFLLSDSGKIIAQYDKIHLFDVALANGENYNESDRFISGSKAEIATTPWGILGFSICYDLRFPHLYRSLAKAGASLLSVPAAFTQTTGEKHWHVLLRARAIENSAFVIAPAQVGLHASGRRTYGHSLIVSPDGTILAEGDADKEQIIFAEYDSEAVIKSRASIPSLALNAEFRAAQFGQ